MTAPDPDGHSAYRSVDGLDVTLDGPVLCLTLDRPSRRNAIDDTMMEGLIDAFDRAGRDEAVRVVALSGHGEHFCSGADIVARNQKPSAGGADGDGGADRAPAPDPRPRVGSIQRRVPSLAHRLIPLMATVQVPIVCRVQGWAAGIGFQMALASDFTVAAHDAKLWEPFTERGFTPDSGATWLLPRLVGPVRARQLLILGRTLTGAEAADWGLVHQTVASAELDEQVDGLVARLAAAPTVAVGLTKWLLHAGADATFEAQLRNEALALELSSRSRDFREGLAAFAQKRPPEFQGR